MASSVELKAFAVIIDSVERGEPISPLSRAGLSASCGGSRTDGISAMLYSSSAGLWYSCRWEGHGDGR